MSVKLLLLPILTQEAFVAIDVAVPNKGERFFSHIPFIGIGWHEFKRYGGSIQCGQHHQLEAKVFHIAALAYAVGSFARKAAMFLTAFVAYHGYRLGVEQQLGGGRDSQFTRSVSAKCLDHQAQATCPTVELATINQPGEKGQIVGADEGPELPFAGKRNEVHHQHQGNHLTVTEFWFGTTLPWQHLLSCRVAVILHLGFLCVKSRLGAGKEIPHQPYVMPQFARYVKSSQNSSQYSAIQRYLSLPRLGLSPTFV